MQEWSLVNLDVDLRISFDYLSFFLLHSCLNYISIETSIYWLTTHHDFIFIFIFLFLFLSSCTA